MAIHLNLFLIAIFFFYLQAVDLRSSEVPSIQILKVKQEK